MADPARDSRRRFLDSMLKGGVVLASSASWLPLLSGCAGSKRPAKSAAPSLKPTVDPTTGLALLMLPEGFRYFSFGWRNQALTGGDSSPGNHDGMAIVAQEGNRYTLVRNHEIWEDAGSFSREAPVYDPGAGGGTVVVEVDVEAGALVSARAGLAGTAANCSGGLLPGGRWLSCEELVHVPGTPTMRFDGRPAERFQKAHGFVFEGGPNASAEPLTAMGQFRHEGIAYDAADGTIYQTEDRSGEAGFYRFRPNNPARLADGGVLEMLALEKPRVDLRRRVALGKPMKVRWVRIEDPLRGHASGSDQGGVVAQGIAAGGAIFTRLEGLSIRGDSVYFNATDGGRAGAGQIFVYRPRSETLELIYESPDSEVMDFPDQMYATSEGGLWICQDSKKVERQALWWMAPDGRLATLALNDSEIDGRSYRTAEWSGVCMSADRKWLFANLYTPGCSIAITGPFDTWMAAGSAT